MARKKAKKAISAATSITDPADPDREASQPAQKIAPRPIPQASQKGSQTPPSPAQGMVRRSTLILSVLLALVGGIYVGSLLPGLLHVPAPAVAQAPANPPQQAAEQTAYQSPTERIRQLEQHLGHKDDDVEAWIQLGNLYFDSSQAKNAIRAYERALILKPDNPDVLTDLGIMYRDEKHYDLAAEAFRKATKINPKHQNGLFNRGVVLFFDLGKKDEAREVWRQLLAVNPNARTPDGRSVRDMLQQLK